MIAEAIEKILEHSTSKPREPFIEKDGGRLWLYNDVEQQYEEIERDYVRRHTVSSMPSFVTLVLEELRRSNAPDGNGATLTLTRTGGTLIPRDREDGLVRHTYLRALDPFWQKVVANAGKPMKHAEFVRFLTSIAPVVDNYATVARNFRKVFFDERLAVTSQPLLDADGNGGNSFAVEFTAKGGTTTTALPGGFAMELCYGRGNPAHYPVTAEVDLQLRKDGEKSVLMFSYFIPSIEAVEAQAMDDEEVECRRQLSRATALLILTNY